MVATAMRFPNDLLGYRVRSGKSQRAVAESLGISRARLSSWERGWAVPNLADARCLADFYGVSITELYPSESVRRIIFAFESSS